jgi:hypothetical protein
MAIPEVFPFGRLSTLRPPRRPTGPSRLFVLGVYPSALHVRWTPPAWAKSQLGIDSIAALAVDNEPTVFWDGADATRHFDLWRAAVGFRDGDETGNWGHASPAGNGTSGRPVLERVLKPLGVGVAETWFSDVVNRFFVKRGTAKKRQQADAISGSYTPFATELALPAAVLPERPRPEELIDLALREHRERIRSEIAEAKAPVVVTLGEEARRVLLALADHAEGSPTMALDRRRLSESPKSYGAQGGIRIGDIDAAWHALVHPGQRSEVWKGWHDEWIACIQT